LKRSNQFGANVVEPAAVGLAFINKESGQVGTKLRSRLYELLKLQINHFFD